MELVHNGSGNFSMNRKQKIVRTVHVLGKNTIRSCVTANDVVIPRRYKTYFLSSTQDFKINETVPITETHIKTRHNKYICWVLFCRFFWFLTFIRVLSVFVLFFISLLLYLILVRVQLHVFSLLIISL